MLSLQLPDIIDLHNYSHNEISVFVIFYDKPLYSIRSTNYTNSDFIWPNLRFGTLVWQLVNQHYEKSPYTSHNIADLLKVRLTVYLASNDFMTGTKYYTGLCLCELSWLMFVCGTFTPTVTVLCHDNLSIYEIL